MKIRNRHRHHQENDRAAEINPSSNDVVDTTLSLLSPSIFAVPENIKSAEHHHHLEAATTINLAKFRDESVEGFLGLGITANCSRNCNKDGSSDDQASNLLEKSVKEIDNFGIDGGSSIQGRRIAQTLIPGSNQDQARASSNNKINHLRRRITALNPTAPQNKRALAEFLEKEEERAPESNKRLKTTQWGDGFWSRFGFGLETNQSRVFKRCSILLGRLMKHKHSWVFNDPVDAKAMGLPDYHDIVKHPMDLGTIKSSLSLNRYKSPSDFAEDVRLVFRNAMAYNPKGQDVHIMAQQLSEVFEEQWVIITESSEFNSQPHSGSAPPAFDRPKPVVTRRKGRKPDACCSAPAAFDRPKPVVTRRKGRKPDAYPEPINPPEELVQLIGPDITPVFVYRKQLVEWDTRKDQNRLFVNDREKLMDFMTEEERRAVEDDKKPGIDLIGIDRIGREYKLHSNKWASLDIAVLNGEWHKIVVANRAKKGNWVHLWAYRRAETVVFCLFVDFREQP